MDVGINTCLFVPQGFFALLDWGFSLGQGEGKLLGQSSAGTPAELAFFPPPAKEKNTARNANCAAEQNGGR